MGEGQSFYLLIFLSDMLIEKFIQTGS